MLHSRIKSNRDAYKRDLTPDKLVNSLPVDQYPVKDFNINECGFPKSDVTIMVEMATKVSTNEDDWKAFASRITKISKSTGVKVFDPQTKKFNRDAVTDLVHKWKPSWIQTAGEEAAYVEWFCKNDSGNYRAEWEKDEVPDTEAQESSDAE